MNDNKTTVSPFSKKSSKAFFNLISFIFLYNMLKKNFIVKFCRVLKT
jgi:hypothetical protein